jgi:hypothetical protein
MIVFYLVENGQCMLSIDCDPSEIAVEEGKAYWRGQVVNNNMTLSAYAEVPKQSIYTESVDETGMTIQIPKLFSELDTDSPITPSGAARLKALEDAMLELLGGGA